MYLVILAGLVVNKSLACQPGSGKGSYHTTAAPGSTMKPDWPSGDYQRYIIDPVVTLVLDDIYNAMFNDRNSEATKLLERQITSEIMHSMNAISQAPVFRALVLTAIQPYTHLIEHNQSPYVVCAQPGARLATPRLLITITIYGIGQYYQWKAIFDHAVNERTDIIVACFGQDHSSLKYIMIFIDFLPILFCATVLVNSQFEIRKPFDPIFGLDENDFKHGVLDTSGIDRLDPLHHQQHSSNDDHQSTTHQLSFCRRQL